ncbi:MAG TPA: hypothetical protein VFD22_08105, partial [Gemmatimonadaceae bacterium]|nr:hypothetical protein [Gemmatimonadaceae bacterium]
MTRHLFATIALMVVVAPCTSPAQTTSASSRTREIAQLFSKSKHSVKEKRGVRVEKYKNVTAEPVVASNPANYSGTYRSLDFDFTIRLQVAANGLVEGSGIDVLDSESHIARPFTLEKATIDGALFTATKVYRDGRRESIEGVFIDRTSHDSPDDPGVKVFGLGVLAKAMQIDGSTIDRLFYERVVSVDVGFRPVHTDAHRAN